MGLFDIFIKSDYDLLVSKMRIWKRKYLVDNGSRTSERQKSILSIILDNPQHDLYRMSPHTTSCAFCAARAGRVYSRSGKDPDFPPLALAFRKIDEKGPDVLWNTYLIPHPNCLHTFMIWTPMGRTEEEIRQIKRFSSLKTNPLSHDPRSAKAIAAYENKEAARKRWLRSYKLYERCTAYGIDKFPKTFQTFDKHKKANSEKYQEWMRQYRLKKAEDSPLDL